MVWKGVIIEESLNDKELLKMVKIVSTKKTTLENQKEKGILHFHRLGLNDDKKDDFVKNAELAIKNGWYLHICKDGKMIVVFRNKHFEFTENSENLNKAREYGLSIGIIKEQLTFENLIENPYG